MASLYKLPPEQFARRRNNDGTTDSICLTCFANVACAPHEATLGPAEAAHDCWQRHEAELKHNLSRAQQA